MKLRELINLEANEEKQVFLKSARNGKITPNMKYKAFMEAALTTFKPVITTYLEGIKKQMEACDTKEQLSQLVLPVMTPKIAEETIVLIEKQKHLDIVEQTYLFLDLWRMVTGEIGTRISGMAMHYGNTLSAGKIIRPGGGKIIMP